jgi:ABC-type bacteriocin/lantibiotic exporter with double-glycine peptidase domain
MKKLITILLILKSSLAYGEQIFQFKSPSFSGIGYSSHIQTIENTETTRKQALESARLQAAKDAAKAEKEKQKAEKLAMKQQKSKGPAQELVESGICWTGYKRKPGTKKYSPGSCFDCRIVGSLSFDI